jgi:hypothetical protein
VFIPIDDKASLLISLAQFVRKFDVAVPHHVIFISFKVSKRFKNVLVCA